MDNHAKGNVNGSVLDCLFTEMNVNDNLAKSEIIIIQLNSANRSGRAAAEIDGKGTSTHCLGQYQSKKFKLLATNRFRKQEKKLRQ